MDNFVLILSMCAVISLQVTGILSIKCAVCTGSTAGDFCDIESDLHISYSTHTDCDACMKITTTSGAVVSRTCVKGTGCALRQASTICTCVKDLCNSDRADHSSAPYGAMIASHTLAFIVVLGIVALRWQCHA